MAPDSVRELVVRVAYLDQRSVVAVRWSVCNVHAVRELCDALVSVTEPHRLYEPLRDARVQRADGLYGFGVVELCLYRVDAQVAYAILLNELFVGVDAVYAVRLPVGDWRLVLV